MNFEKNNNSENVNLSQDVLVQLGNLGLNPSEIKGDVLDIGAGEGEFAKELKKVNNAKIISIDNQQQSSDFENVIVADVRNLPFEENTFDRVISHASVPNFFITMYSPEFPELSREEIRKTILKSFREILRVLKSASTATLAPIRIAENYESEKVFAKSLQDAIQEIKNEGTVVNFELIREAENAVSKEKYCMYRLTILKK